MLAFSRKISLLTALVLCILLLTGCKDDKEVYYSYSDPAPTPEVNSTVSVSEQSRDEYTEPDDVLIPDNGEGTSDTASSGVASVSSEAVTQSSPQGSSSVAANSSDVTASAPSVPQSSSQSSTLAEPSSDKETTVPDDESSSSSVTSSDANSVKDPIVLPDDVW